jgi:plasmid maintenance system antidote protein VapI
MLDAYLETAKEIAKLKLLEPTKENAEKIGKLQQKQLDSKQSFEAIRTKSYGEMQTASGLDAKVYNQLSVDIQNNMSKVGDALKVAMDELAKSTGASPEVIAKLQNNVKLAQEAVDKAKPRTYNDRQSASGIDAQAYDKLTAEFQLKIDDVSIQLKTALDKLANSVNSSPEVLANLKEEVKQSRKKLDEAISEGFDNTGNFDKTAQALKTAGVSIDNGLRKATDKQLETMRNLANDIAKAEIMASEATSEALRIKAQEIIDEKSETLNRLISEAKVSPAEEAGKSFADNVTNSFSSGLKSIFSSEKSVGEVFKEIALNFAKNVTDTVTDGLIKGFMGSGEGSLTQWLRDLGAGLFGGAAAIGELGSSAARAMWVQFKDATGIGQGGEDPIAKAEGGIMSGIKGAWNKITGNDTGNGTEYDSEGNPYARLPDNKMLEDYTDITQPITDAINNTSSTEISSNQGLFSELGGLFSKGLSGLVTGFQSLFTGGMGGGGGGGGFDFSSILGMFGGGGQYSSGSWYSGILNMFNGFATGGLISGSGHGTSDSILARVSNGEYIINAQATKANRAILDAINYGKPIGFATGGVVGGGVSASAITERNQSMGLTKGRSEQVFNINVTGDISRQTRKEIQTMMPQIATGVNHVNKENNYR